MKSRIDNLARAAVDQPRHIGAGQAQLPGESVAGPTAAQRGLTRSAQAPIVRCTTTFLHCSIVKETDSDEE